MQTDKYRLTFKGELKEGVSPESVKSQLAKMFKVGPKRLEQLFSGRRVVVKKNIDRATGEKMQRRLAQIGALFDLEPEADPSAGATPGRLPEMPHATSAQFAMDEGTDPFAESIRMLSAAEDGAVDDPAALPDLKITPQPKGFLQSSIGKVLLLGMSAVVMGLIVFFWAFYQGEVVPPEPFLERALRTVYTGSNDGGTRPLYLSVREFVDALDAATLAWKNDAEEIWVLSATREPAAGNNPVTMELTFKPGHTTRIQADVVLAALSMDQKVRKPAAISSFAQKIGQSVYYQMPSTSLVSAVKQQDIKLLHKLLTLGQGVITPEELHQGLVAAAEQGALEAVAALIKAGATPDARDAQGRTALASAARNSQWEVVRELIKTPISGHSKGQALVMAVQEQNRDMAELLISRGADVRVTNDAGYTPLMLAIASGQKEVFNSLMNRRNALDLRSKESEPKTAFGLALEQSQIAMAIHLLERGASPKLPLHYGPALMWAVNLNNPALARVLVKKGVDIGGVDAAGDTALMGAVKRQQPEMVNVLLMLKADPNQAHANTGATALMLAAEKGDVQIAKMLIEAKADPQLRDKQQRTARDYAPQNADKALQALLTTPKPRRAAVKKAPAKTPASKSPLSNITGRYSLPKGAKQGYLSISTIKKSIITFSLHTFQGSECHLENRRVKLFYSKTYGSYWGKFTSDGCTLNFTYYPDKKRNQWVFDIKAGGTCDRFCGPQGRVAGRYVKDAS